MVQVRRQSYLTAEGEVDIQRWLADLPLPLQAPEAERLLAACQLVQGDLEAGWSPPPLA